MGLLFQLTLQYIKWISRAKLTCTVINNNLYYYSFIVYNNGTVSFLFLSFENTKADIKRTNRTSMR